ncbi:MAG: hypothetical protein ACQZ3N_10060 [cyanobacterium endosymbiont of Rhopalodia yunnanensis]
MQYTFRINTFSLIFLLLVNFISALILNYPYLCFKK